MKKFLIVVFAVCLLFVQAVPTFAAAKTSVVPLWDNVRQIDCNVSFSGTSGKVRCTVTGCAGTTSISGTATLYIGKTKVDSWDITGNSVAVLSETFTGISGTTYRLELDIKVTTNGVVEPITMEDSATCP